MSLAYHQSVSVHLQVVAGGDTTVTGPSQEQAAGALTPSCIFQDDLGYELWGGIHRENGLYITVSVPAHHTVPNCLFPISPPQYKTITLGRGPDGLGFSIVGGYGSPHGDLPIYVKTVFGKVCQEMSPVSVSRGACDVNNNVCVCAGGRS